MITLNFSGIHALLPAVLFLYFCSLLSATFYKRKDVGLFLLISGWVLHGAYMIQRGWITGAFIPNAMFEGVFLLPWAIALAVIILRMATCMDFSWETGLPVVCLFMLFPLIYPKGIIPPTPNKLSLWAHAFFLTECAGHACFYLGAVFALRKIVRTTSDDTFNSLIIWGFVFYSISQITGAIWAYQGWASTFRWGSRHMQSAVIWLYFATYLHLRFLPGWQKTRKLVFASAGFPVVVMCTFGSFIHEMDFPRIGG